MLRGMNRPVEPVSDAGAYVPTERTRVRRGPKRADYDRAFVHSVLDEAFVCHLATVVDGRPLSLPFAHARVGEQIYVHGSVKNHILCAIAAGAEVCVNVMRVDGLVLARSAFHHSMNYRAVVCFGQGRVVDDPEEKLAALDALVDRMAPDRSKLARAPNDVELRATLVLSIPLGEVSGKRRAGDPVDDAEDMGLPVWAGVVPLQEVLGAPVPAGDLKERDLAPPQVG